MKPYAISVCVTCYNHEKFIAQCIESILAQKGINLAEIIVGDDVSADKSWDIIQRFSSIDGRVKARRREATEKIYIDGKPTGVANLVSCLDEATGDFIALCDGDDYWTDQWKLRKQIDLMADYKVDLVGHRAVVVGEDGVFGKRVGRSDRCGIKCFNLRQMIRFDGNIMPVSSILLSRKSKEYVKDTLSSWQVRGHSTIQILGASVSGACVSNEVMGAYRVGLKGSTTAAWFGSKDAVRSITRQRFEWAIYFLNNTDIDNTAMVKLSARRLADIGYTCGFVEQTCLLFSRKNFCDALRTRQKIVIFCFSLVYLLRKIIFSSINPLRKLLAG